MALAVLLAGYAGVAVLAGAPRSPLVPPLPPGVSIPAPLASAARALGLGGLGSGALVALGVGLAAVLVAAFAALAREAWFGRIGRGAVVGAGAAALAIAVAAPPLLSRDVHSYASYGRIVAVHDGNPYVLAPGDFPRDVFTPVVSRAWMGSPSVYGPAFTLASAAIAAATRDAPTATILAFKLLAGVSILGAALLGARAAAAARDGSRAVFTVAVVALNPVVVLHTVGGGHNDALVALAVAAGAALALVPGATGRHRIAVTALLTLGALVKPVAAVPLALWLLRAILRAPPGRARLAAVASHLGAVVALVVASAAPFVDGARALAPVARVAGLEGWASPARLVARGARAVVGGTGGEIATAVVHAVFLAAFLVGVTVLVRRSGGRPDVGAWPASLLLLVLAAPYLLPWYVAWFLPVLALLRDPVLVGVGVAASCLLALTGIPAEPAAGPEWYRAMLLAVHYLIAPAVLALLLVALRRVLLGGGTASDRDAGERSAAAGP